jgi:metallo-beta-lactamase class B
MPANDFVYALRCRSGVEIMTTMHFEFSLARLIATLAIFAGLVSAHAQSVTIPTGEPSSVQTHIDFAQVAAGQDPNLQSTLSLCLGWPAYRSFLQNMPDQKRVSPPIKAFDQLYYLGMKSVGSWVLVTSDGIIQFDSLDNPEEAERIIVGGYKQLGLNPADMKYLVITHYHADHSGGARYLQDKYHPHVLMGGADWDMLAKQPAFKSDGSPNLQPPVRDISVEDGQKLTLGKTTITLYLTPGHTPGTVSSIIPVTDHGEPHLVSFLGGTAYPQNKNAIQQSKSSLERFAKIGEDDHVDSLISNHSWFDNTYTGSDSDKGARIRARKPGDLNPFVVGQDGFVRYMMISLECEAADEARLQPATGE